MATNNYNMIKPVEGLPNVSALTPAKRRKEKERKQTEDEQHEDEQQNGDEELSQSIEEAVDFDSKLVEEDGDKHSIDYRA